MSTLLSGGGYDAGPQQNQEAAQQKSIQLATQNIQNAFAGFNPDWYQQQYQNVLASEEPQEQQQFKQASNQLGFKLADQGLGKSSQAKQLGESLASAQDTAQQGLASGAQSEVNQLKQQQEQAESNLIGEASVANTPGTVAGQAYNTASTLQSPLSAQPIGQLFGNWSNAYLAGTNAAGVNATNASQGLGSIGYGGGGDLPLGSSGSTGYGSSFMNSTSTVK